MKRERIKINVGAFLLVLCAGSAFARVTFTPIRPNAEQPVTFLVTNPSGIIVPGSVRWRFGDGTSVNGPTTVNKTYTAAGTYIVEVTYNTSKAVPNWKTETAAITVEEKRRITFTPSAPFVNQGVTFVAQNFLSGSIRWDFGDGTPPALLSATVPHAFKLPGTFIVQARDLGGTSVANITATISIKVDASRRRITYSPETPVVGRPVAFRAENFYTDEIRWDFGDGTPPLISSVNETHVFLRPGAFTVRASDWAGRFGEAVMRAVVVWEETGARASFKVSFIQLRFDDGKSYKVVAQNARPLLVFADIRYEGTGLFQVQWLVDGQPFALTTKAMPFFDFLTIDSGEVPGLPTQALGMHEVSLKILQPQTGLETPVIRYFVTASEGPELKRADVELMEAAGVEGVECSLEQDTLQAPSGSYAILRGNVRSGDIPPVAWALLRIHVGSELADQLLLKDLRPGEKKEFVTSIFNPSPDPKIITITLYDITRKPPELLFFRKLSLQQK